jgi:tetratricopeptide (TPR) repeat protein
MAFDTFISYSESDKSVADAACAALESAGVGCWIAPRDVLPGSPWAAAIVHAIENCRVMVLVFSARANISNQILREVEAAVRKGKPVIPLRIENVEPNESMEHFLHSIHWLDALTPPLEGHFRRLADAVKSSLADQKIAASSAVIQSSIADAFDRARAYYNRGVEYCSKGLFDKAVSDLTEAIKLDPDYADAYAQLGYSYNGREEWHRAIGAFKRAIELDPNNASAFFNLGWAYGQLHDYDRVIDAFDSSISIDPTSSGAFVNRGYAYAAKGDLKRAMADYDEAIRLNSVDASALYYRGKAKIRLGDSAGGQADIAAARKIDPIGFAT